MATYLISAEKTITRQEGDDKKHIKNKIKWQIQGQAEFN